MGTEPDRRTVLKGLGAGTLALPALAGAARAEQASCSLQVNVEAGEGDSSNWVQRDYITDDFRGKIDVAGVRSGAELAYVMIPTSPDGGFVGASNVRSNVVETRSSSESIIHTNTWAPSVPFMNWPTGTYNLYAMVADRTQESFGVAISEPFEIDP